MGGYVYLLKSSNYNWRYIGSTKDLKLRLSQHNAGMVKSTKFYKPLILIYYEAYPDYSLARKRELELKNNGQQKEILFARLDSIKK
jgi:predicted GIY-YIG superfamily endonuclease